MAKKKASRAKPRAPLFYYLETDDDFTAGVEVDPVLASLPNLIAYEYGTVAEGEEAPEGSETFKTQAQLTKRVAKADKANELEFERAEKAGAALDDETGEPTSTTKAGRKIIGGR